MFFKSSFEEVFLLILESGGVVEKNFDVRETHQPVASRTRPDWGSNLKPGFVRGGEWNPQPLVAQGDPPTDPHRRPLREF